MVVSAVTPSLAHWVTATSADVAISSGQIVVGIDGDLSLDIEGCIGEPGEPACHKFEDLRGYPILTSGDVEFEILEWIDKQDDDDEGDGEGNHVGFRYRLVGGSADLTIKSGNVDNGKGSRYEITLEPDTSVWLNPWCELINGDTAATCNPHNTSGISYVDVCLKPTVDVGCAEPSVAEAVLSNQGSIPFSLALEITDVTGMACLPGTPAMDVVLTNLNTGSDFYTGSLCFLMGGVDLLIADQLDPGDSFTMELRLEVGTGECPPPGGIDLSLMANFVATQWNSPSGWAVTKPMPISVTADVLTPLAGDPQPRLGDPPPPAEPPPPEDPPADDPPAEDPPPPVEPPPSVTSSLSGVAWLDDGDGVRGPGENGIGAIDVGLYDGIGEVVTTTVTNATGSYEFADVAEGTYRVRFEAPNGMAFVAAGAGDDSFVDSDVVEVGESHGLTGEIVVAEGFEAGQADAGLTVPPPEEPPGEEPPPGEPPTEDPPPPEEPPPSAAVSMSGVVWIDDGDGVRADPDPTGEPPAAGEDRAEGVEVGLYDADGTLVGQATTDIQGSYIVSEVPEGAYEVRFGAPDGFTFVDPGLGDDPTIDSDVVAVEVMASEGGPDRLVGNTGVVELASGMDLGLADAGLVVLPSVEPPPEPEPVVVDIGGVVWSDDGDGVRAAAEVGLADVSVVLHEVAGVSVAETITDGDGLYQFVEVAAGSYLVRFVTPEGMTFVVAGAGDDPLLDSDVVNVADGHGSTGELAVGEGFAVGLADAGLMALPAEDSPPEEPPAEDPVEPAIVTISGVAWLDDDDGVRIDPDPEADPPEPGEDRAGGVRVGLYTASRQLIEETSTDPDGLYEFADVPEGSYVLRFKAPGGFTFTRAGAGTDRALDSDVTEVETIENDDVIVEILGWTRPIDFVSETEPDAADAGIVPLPPSESEGDAPPAEDPGELATEPPEVGGKEDETTVDPLDSDDATPDDGEADTASDGGGTDA